MPETYKHSFLYRIVLERYFAILKGKSEPRFIKNRNLIDDYIERAKRHYNSCNLCEWHCKVDRRERRGVCRIGEYPRISAVFIHYGEEEVLVPSLTVFFSGCNFRCVFCQNWDISQQIVGKYIPPEKLAKMIESHTNIRNVNWVGGEPTPNIPYILEVLKYLKKPVPQVWNSNMYLSEEGMKLITPFMDIYLGDFKYGNDECARKYSGIRDYFEIVSRNFLKANKHGEIIVRHLILPSHLECCTFPVLEWISQNIPNAAVSLMAQYHPYYRARKYGEIARRISKEEYIKAYNYAKKLKLILLDEERWLEFATLLL